MDQRLEMLFALNPTLRPDYVRDILGLSGEQAAQVDKISGGIHRDEVELVARIVDELDPATSLEVGLGYGFSALAICSSGRRATSERRHIVMDPHQSSYWGGNGLENLAAANVRDMVEFHEDASYRVLPKLEAEGVEVDFAFIDGWHTFDFVFVDLFYVDKLLRPGGVVMFDDANWASIRPVIRFAVTNLGYAVHATLPEKGPRALLDRELGLEGSCIAVRKPLEPVNRPIFHHTPFLGDT
jgi:predicted O-methyltransferase YrrM